MEPRPSRVAERRRVQEQVAARKRKTSIVTGILGLVLLFAGSIGVLISPSIALVMIVVMGTGIVLLLVAFLLVRGPIAALPGKTRDN